MKTNWLVCALLMVALAAPVRGELIFTNVTPAAAATLNAVTYDGNGTFVAVGEGSSVLAAGFGGSLTWLSTNVPGAAVSLKSITHDSSRFVAGGANASIFVAPNAATWSQTNNAFGVAAGVQGLAFSPTLNRYAAAASILNITYSDTLASWVNATIPSGILIESFRGLTVLPGGEFAVCGLRGDIRISTGSGTSWGVNRPFNGSEPDLLGIAAGGGMIMSVGTAGRVLVSSDNGASWTNNASPIGTINNAIAFAGNEFIVAGTGGQILTGTNAVPAHWKTNAIFSASPVSASLRGVTFATTGVMQGLALLVGDNGTVILGGPRPREFTNPVSQTVCSSSGDTNLSVTLDTTGFPSGTLVVEWFNDNGVLVASNLAVTVSSYAATNTIPDGGNAPSTFTYTVRARDLRTQFINTNNTQVTLTINPRPSLTLNSLTITNCNSGLTNTLTGTVRGVGPWTLQWNDGTIQNVTNIGSGPVSFSRDVVATNALPNQEVTTLYFVTSVADANCVAIPSIDLSGTNSITVFPTPTVDVVANQGPYCNASAGLAINFSGPVPGSTFSWTSTADVGFGTSGNGNIAAFTAINGGTAPVVATVTVTPTANGCSGASVIFTVTVNPTPTVNAVANQGPYCNTNGGLAINFSGPVLGTTFAWTSTADVGFGTSGNGNIAGFTAINNGTSPVAATVTVTPTANGCVGTPSTFTVTVNPTPTVNAVANQGPYCDTNGGLAINFSGPVLGTTFSWTSTINVGFGTSGNGNIAAFTATNGSVAPVVATVTVTPIANGCVGTPSTFTVTVNPTPTVNVVANQGPYCNTNGGLAINFSGPVLGTTFAWTSTADVGFGTGGAGNIGAFTATTGNPTNNVSVIATVTVTPTANGCVGTPRTFTVTVNPTPTVNPVANQGPYCDTSAGLAVSFSGPVAGTTFAWTSTVDVGFGASGNGNIAAFTTTNGGAAPVVATVTVTPTANGCIGTPSSFTVTVNPTATVTSVSNQTQTLSVGQMTSPVTLTGIATSFIWTNNNTSIGLGPNGTVSATGGVAVFDAFMATNSGTATITVTPRYSNGVDCVAATATNFVITVTNVITVSPSFTIQLLSSTNVVLEWVAQTNTALLSATNLTSPITWLTNGTYGAGTNRVTNSILFDPPNQFFRLTNAP